MVTTVGFIRVRRRKLKEKWCWRRNSKGAVLKVRDKNAPTESEVKRSTGHSALFIRPWRESVAEPTANKLPNKCQVLALSCVGHARAEQELMCLGV